mmetsp:Transcript_49047/g.144730  ORF Transcript_49047/g.144730 Transcript_49047/m.144730 type:complete len:362 (-) Transcript_49047:108-1193(-)
MQDGYPHRNAGADDAQMSRTGGPWQFQEEYPWLDPLSYEVPEALESRLPLPAPASHIVPMPVFVEAFQGEPGSSRLLERGASRQGTPPRSHSGPRDQPPSRGHPGFQGVGGLEHFPPPPSLLSFVDMPSPPPPIERTAHPTSKGASGEGCGKGQGKGAKEGTGRGGEAFSNPSQLRKTELCRFWQVHCVKGDRCHFAHGLQELQPKPWMSDAGRSQDHGWLAQDDQHSMGSSSSSNVHGLGNPGAKGGGPGGYRSQDVSKMVRQQFRKTEICRFWQFHCDLGNRCPFAHGPEELLPRPDLHKTSLCGDWQRGCCRLKASRCPFAHGFTDMRSTPGFVQAMNTVQQGPTDSATKQKGQGRER